MSTTPAANLPPVSFTMGAIIKTADNLKWTLKKLIYMLALLPKGDQKES